MSVRTLWPVWHVNTVIRYYAEFLLGSLLSFMLVSFHPALALAALAVLILVTKNRHHFVLLGLIKAFFVILLTSYKYIIIFFCQIVNRLCLFSKIKFKQKKLPRLSRKLSKFLITCLLKKQVGANLNTHGLLTTKWKQACTPYQEISPS